MPNNDWNQRIELAEKMIPLLGQLRRNNNVVTSIFGSLLDNATAVDIVKSHRYARRISGTELSLHKTYPIVELLTTLNLGTASIDLGELAVRYDERGGDLEAFLREELADVIDAPVTTADEVDVVLYGFGRIGRLLARILLAKQSYGRGVNLRAIVVRKNGDDDLQKRASLLRRDSVHGAFDGTIKVDEDNNIIWANGTPIQVIYSSDPATVDYTEYGINNAIVVDNTGRWRDRQGLSQHLKSTGVSKVLLTAPGKGDIKKIGRAHV